MKTLVQLTLCLLLIVVIFSSCGLLSKGDTYCDDTTQYVDDQSWYELCK